jgi:hypothetical protein
MARAGFRIDAMQPRRRDDRGDRGSPYPTRSDPANSQFLRSNAGGPIARSTGL